MALIKQLKELDETIYPITKGEAVVMGSGKNVEQEIADIKHTKKPYLSLESKGSYLYEVTFDKLPDYKEVGFDTSGCSSFVRDGKLYRNLDWKYDETAEFVVKYNDGYNSITGMSFISQLTQSNLDDELIGQLPYHISDGVNQYGIMVATHVIFNDWGWKKSTYGGIPLNTIPLRILESIRTMTGGEWEDLAYDLFPYMEATPAIQESGYLLQFLVTDGTTTKVILPPDSDGQPYTIVDATSNPKLTNFRWVDSASVVRANLQTRPTGVERWNMMPSALSELRFTKAYESANRLSEFIGIDGTTKNSTDQELTTIYNKAKAIYDMRYRDGQTWQTMHSVVYSNRGMEELYTQENWDVNYGHILANNSVSTEKIMDSAVTTNKLSNSSVTSDKLADGSVTNAKIGSAAVKSNNIDWSTMIDKIYPVGSIYMSVNNVSPQTFIGGTWVSWGAGKVPVGVNASETEFATVEKTGGAKTVTLTIDQIPSHHHGMAGYYPVSSGNTGVGPTGLSGASGTGLWYQTKKDTPEFKTQGGGKSHTNLQPYITCYMWKRTK